MTFDWMQPKRNASYTKTLLAKREAMYRGELVERAALLHRLGHGKAAVRARLAANLGWDFDGAASAIAGELDAIVEREFGAARATPRNKGGAK
jgi:HD superfamily phosphodiesterase